MEQDKNKEASFGSRETTETEQAPFDAKQEETQSAHEAARQEFRELAKSVRKAEILAATAALCSILEERKLLFDEIKEIELHNLNGEKCPEEAASVFYRMNDNNERELLYIQKLTGIFDDEGI